VRSHGIIPSGVEFSKLGTAFMFPPKPPGGRRTRPGAGSGGNFILKRRNEQMKRKLLVSLLVLSMVLCLLPAGAAAEGIVGTQYNTVSAGYFHAAAIDSNGGLWTWGRNSAGQLGNGGVGDIREEDPYYKDYKEIYQSAPVKIMDDVVSVSANKVVNHVTRKNYDAMAAIKSDGSLWVWGNADFIGTGGKGNSEAEYRTLDTHRTYRIQNVPTKLMDNVASVSMGGDFNFALKTDGTLYTWAGWGGTPVKIMDNVISVSAGPDSVAVIKNDNSLWICDEMSSEGSYDYDSDTYTCIFDPKKIEMEKVMDGVAAVMAGPSLTYGLVAAIKTDGSLWVWGTLAYRHKLSSPIKVMDEVLSVSVCQGLIEVIKLDNSLWRFEFSYNGNAKYDEPTDPADWSFTTEKVMDGVSEVSFGSGMVVQGPDYTIVKKTDGSVWAWGSNKYYCVGNGGKGDSTDEYGTPVQKTPVQIIAGGTTPPVDQPTVIETTGTVPDASGRAYANTQTIMVDGKAVTFETYALHDSDGYPTNYIKLRDLAYTINGTKAQFDVVWDGSISLNRGVAYKPNGSEMETPFSGDRDYKKGGETLTIDGKPYTVQCFMLFDDLNDGYTYYKLRDLGMALGFNVGWDTQTARVFIETDKPYVG